MCSLNPHRHLQDMQRHAWGEVNRQYIQMVVVGVYVWGGGGGGGVTANNPISSLSAYHSRFTIRQSQQTMHLTFAARGRHQL